MFSQEEEGAAGPSVDIRPGLPHARGHRTSDFDFGAELDDLTGGDPEELGRMRRNAGQPRIETLAPSCHSRALGRFDIEPPDKERHLPGIKIEPRYIRTAKLARNIRRLRKAEMDLDLPEARAELLRANPIFACHSGDVLGDNADKQHSAVQHFVVLEVV